MIECNMNVTCSRHFDWFHGGLNFHHEHHCFPRLPRDRLREVSYMIKERCRNADVHYEEMGFWEAIARMGKQMRKMQIKFNQIDIRN